MNIVFLSYNRFGSGFAVYLYADSSSGQDGVCLNV